MTTQETEGKGGDQGDLNAEGKRILDTYRILFDLFKLQNDKYFKRIQILMVVIQIALFTAAFKFVSVSADNPDEYDKVLNFLRTKHSAIDNYIFDKQDKYALIEEVDSNWNGALPYTQLVEPGGKIIFSNQGIVDLLELKRAIIENKLLGRYNYHFIHPFFHSRSYAFKEYETRLSEKSENTCIFQIC